MRTEVLTAGYTDAPSWASGIERVELETLFLTGTTFDPAAHTAGSPQDYLIKSSWPSNCSWSLHQARACVPFAVFRRCAPSLTPVSGVAHWRKKTPCP